MTPDLERWKQLVAKGKRWGGTVPVAEFAAAVAEVERLQGELDEDPWPYRAKDYSQEVVADELADAGTVLVVRAATPEEITAFRLAGGLGLVRRSISVSGGAAATLDQIQQHGGSVAMECRACGAAGGHMGDCPIGCSGFVPDVENPERCDNCTSFRADHPLSTPIWGIDRAVTPKDAVVSGFASLASGGVPEVIGSADVFPSRDTCPSCGELAHPNQDCGEAFGISEAEVEAGDHRGFTSAVCEVLDALDSAGVIGSPPESAQLSDISPTSAPSIDVDTQTPALASPAPRGKRPDRAKAFNDFSKALRAQGKTKPEILQAWKQQKGQG